MSNNTDYLGTLAAAILIHHQCRASHKEGVLVEEKTKDGEIVWQGCVETFELTDNPHARTCYAWQHVDGRGHARIVTVIATPFIDSPRRAVQAVIFSDDAQPVGVTFSSEIELLRKQVENGRDLLRESQIIIEDLTASIYMAEGIRDFLRETRNVSARK